MKKLLILFLIIIISGGCGSTKKLQTDDLQINFLDDYIIPSKLQFEGTTVGGLSGIEYHDGNYFLVCDHPGNPRFYSASLVIEDRKIDTVILTGHTSISKTSDFLKDKTLDLEAIRYHPQKNQMVVASEGSINNGKNPAIFEVDLEGNYASHFSLPEYFQSEGDQQPRNNGVFEGLATSFDEKGYWAGMELPLKKDGSKPKLFPTKSPVRITHFDKSTGFATRQFVLELENITKIPLLYFAINGLTELLEYAPNKFLVLERAFSAGYGTDGNTVRIFDVDASNATNTLKFDKLRGSDYKEATKKLVFDFKNIRKDLKEKIIDNIEGMTFGPDLPNGNKTLLLVSDDNFSSFGRQITQIILLEVEFKKAEVFRN